MTNWQYTDATHLVVSRVLENSSVVSCLVIVQEVQDWIAAGNTPLPYVPPILAPAQQIAALQAAVQTRLDAFAQERYYDGILSACTYATDKNPRFASDGQTCVDARSSTWAACYQVLGEVQTGKRPIPTLDELVAKLPQLRWPA